MGVGEIHTTKEKTMRILPIMRPLPVITPEPPITIQPWPLPVVPGNGNGGIVPPWLIPAPKPVDPNKNPGIVPPWLQ